MSKRGRGWGWRPTRRPKGVAKAMAQAGVEWDPMAAAKVRQESSGTIRSASRSDSRPERPSALPATPKGGWIPLSALLAASMLGLVGYFIGEVSLAAFPHPLHWLGMIAGAMLGYVGGLVWNRVRGF